ncbi:MAG: ATPase [Hormoscilla sp. GM102CHS1]|nr:ATPase [Hormoscilla sp. GM102CHS1]
MTVSRTICSGFIAAIAFGTGLLMMPFAINPDAAIAGPLDYLVKALFTATSAVCVTGLSLVDVSQYYSFWGQLFICILFQFGGLGYMTANTFLLLLLGKKLGLRDKVALQQSLDVEGIAGIGKLVKSIIAVTLIFELTGVFGLLLVFVPDYGFKQGLGFSIFHSISAFNNAGFSLFSDSLVGYVRAPILNLVITMLIIFGGLGYQVIMELYRWCQNSHSSSGFSLHFKIVTSTTIFLLVLGTIAFFQTEFNNPETLGQLNLEEKLMAAWFQSVTSRTAGFNTIDMGSMTITSLFITIALMTIGASPGSTGGGIKTTTSRILVSCTRAALKGEEEVICYRRQIPTTLILKAVGVVVGSMLVVILATTLFTLTAREQGFNFIDSFFEVVSAFGTTGLSTGITASAPLGAKLVLIGTMYVGRVGVLLLMAAFQGKSKQWRIVRYPEENLLIG